ncbi:MAG: hypothetical protein ACRDHZ_19765 [Ktedonobacteraceae bacterium]
MHVGKRYHLPVVAMVETMKSSPNEVLLQAQCTALPGVSKQVCVAHVIVGQGLIHSCTIVGETGMLLLHQRAAYEALVQCGDLEWQVLPAPVTPFSTGVRHKATGTLGHPPEHAGSADTLGGCIPILRVCPLPRETLATFPHGSRIALVLIDGKRSITTIAQLLHKTPQEIRHLFEHLPHLIKL